MACVQFSSSWQHCMLCNDYINKQQMFLLTRTCLSVLLVNLENKLIALYLGKYISHWRTFWNIVGQETSTMTKGLDWSFWTFSIRGRKFNGQGIQNKTKWCSCMQSIKIVLNGRCIFVNAVTGYIDIKFQSFFSACTTINAVEQFKANAKDNRITVSNISLMKDYYVSYLTSFEKNVASKEEQSNQYSGAGSYHQMEEQNQSFKPSWEWHKQWYFVLQFIGPKQEMQLYGQCVLTMLNGFTIMYLTWRLAFHQTIYGQKLSFHWIDCMMYTYMVLSNTCPWKETG